MKNYLGNLIARHMNQAEVLLPRLASRFEPQSSVLQSEGVQLETAEMDIADTAGVDVTDPVGVDVTDTVGTHHVVNAPVNPIPSGIERRVATPFPPSSRSPESVDESSDPTPAFAELMSSPTTAAAGFENPVLRTTSADLNTAVDRVASTRRVYRDDDSSPESRGEARGDSPTQSAVLDHVAERAPRKPDPITKPIPANEPLAAHEPVTINDQLTETERVTPSLRAASSKSNQSPMQQPVEIEAAVSKPTTETRETTETSSKFEARLRKREPFTTTTKSEPLASGTASEHFTFTVPHSESNSSVGPLKPQQPNSPTTIEHSSREHSSRELLSAVVLPEPKESSPLVNAARETQVSLKQPESVPDEARPTRRTRELETSVARSRANDPRNTNDPGSTRLMPHLDIRPADAGPTIEPAPTINVTIGRIEVRAATSEARPQKQRREQQVLSLDEYLNQRSAGGR